MVWTNYIIWKMLMVTQSQIRWLNLVDEQIKFYYFDGKEKGTFSRNPEG